MGNTKKRRAHNKVVVGALGKLQQSIVGVSSGLSGVSRYLEALIELTGHTVEECRAILERKDKEAQEHAAEQSNGSDATSTGDVGSAPPTTDPQDTKSEPESTA